MDLASVSDRYLAWVLGLNTLIHEIGVPLPLMPTALLAGAQVTEGEANAIALVAHGAQSVAIVLLACAAYVAWKWWRRRVTAGSLQAPRISVPELRKALDGTPAPIVVDVRGEVTRRADPRHVPSALPGTVDAILPLLAEQPKSASIVVYCACPNDASAAQAVRVLNGAGYTQARALRGGLDAWFGEQEAARG